MSGNAYRTGQITFGPAESPVYHQQNQNRPAEDFKLESAILVRMPAITKEEVARKRDALVAELRLRAKTNFTSPALVDGYELGINSAIEQILTFFRD